MIWVRSATACALATLLLTHSNSASAEPPSMDLASIPIARCTTQEVLARTSLAVSRSGADGAQTALELADQLGPLIDKAGDSDRPIRDLLNPEDLATFVTLSEQVKVVQLAAYIDSRRMRDLRVLQKMVQIADRIYRFGDHSSSSPEDETLTAVIIAMREEAETKAWSALAPPSMGACSLNVALALLVIDADRRVDKEKSSSAIHEVEGVLARYGGPSADLSKVSAADKDKIRSLAAEIEPLRSFGAYATDLDNIRQLAEVSELNDRMMRRDALSSGGRIERLGKSAASIREQEQLSERETYASKILGVINERIPSDMIKNLSDQAGSASDKE